MCSTVGYIVQQKKPVELNTIVLKDPVNNVYDSIFKLNNLLDRLPPSQMVTLEIMAMQTVRILYNLI